MALDRDVDRVGGGRSGRDVRELVEDEARDDREDHDRAGRPHQLEPRVPVHLRAFDRAERPRLRYFTMKITSTDSTRRKIAAVKPRMR